MFGSVRKFANVKNIFRAGYEFGISLLGEASVVSFVRSKSVFLMLFQLLSYQPEYQARYVFVPPEVAVSYRYSDFGETTVLRDITTRKMDGS